MRMRKEIVSNNYLQDLAAARSFLAPANILIMDFKYSEMNSPRRDPTTRHGEILPRRDPTLYILA